MLSKLGCPSGEGMYYLLSAQKAGEDVSYPADPCTICVVRDSEALSLPPDPYFAPHGVYVCCAHGIELIITRIVLYHIVLCLK